MSKRTLLALWVRSGLHVCTYVCVRLYLCLSLCLCLCLCLYLQHEMCDKTHSCDEFARTDKLLM